MSDLVIQSHRGPYPVHFDQEGLEQLPEKAHFLVDARLARVQAQALKGVLERPSVRLVEATEAAKSLDRMEGYVEHLLSHNVRRGDRLVAVGGGILQDIVCFLASTLLRGLEWHFYPTTLLAQADSCIGSKSSINVGKAKNLMGTFYPPARITIIPGILATLDPRELRSGIGEMLKVHVLDGPASFDRIAADYQRILQEPALMAHYIRRSLEIKQRFIEEDEFDRGPRNLLNYGHSFGHALESATDFGVPHGIAITLGADMANYVAVRLGLMERSQYDRMHPTLAANYSGFEDHPVPFDPFLAALNKDKKNVANFLRLILPDGQARLTIGTYPCDQAFRTICQDYLGQERQR